MTLPFKLMLAAVAFAGCAVRHTSTRTVEEFRFLQFGMTMHEVTNRIGAPDRLGGRGVPRWEYDLRDGSQIFIIPDSRTSESITNFAVWTVYGFAQVKDNNWLWERWPDTK
jgi:hypothetical protein